MILSVYDLNRFSSVRRIKAPRIFTVLAILTFAVMTGVVIMLAAVPWVQTAYGIGRVIALNPHERPQPINAMVSGRIQQWSVDEGSIVNKGDILVEIADNDSRFLERLEEQRASLKRNLEAARNAAALAKADLERQRSLLASGLSSRKTYEQAKIKYNTKQATVSKSETELNKAKVKLAQQDMQIIRAPRDGMIVNVISGDQATSISAGDRIATLIPRDVTPAVEIYVDGMDISLIHPGRKVRLQFEGWPVVQFSGWPAKAIGTFGGIVHRVDPSASANGRFRAIIIADPHDIAWPSGHYLRLGTHVKGWVQLETVKIGYELWRKMNNFPPEFVEYMPEHHE